MFKKFSTLLLLVLVGFSYANAQAPQSFPYQAVARGAAGNLLSNQNISLRISILDGSNIGPVIFQETFNVTTNSLGLFNINVGQGTLVSGTFAGINWGSGSKFIKVELDPNGGAGFTNMGTSQLLSVPYSLYSNVPGVPGPSGTNGKTILNGTIAPASGIGTNGDFYLNTSTNQLYGPKTAGLWGTPVSLIGPTGATGTAGTNGKSILNGTVPPTAGTGVNGDFYLNTNNNELYGPKTAGVWGTPVSLVGPAGPTGPTGAAGPAGTNGKTILHGSSAPAIGIGVEGDFYINTSSSQLYGPRTLSSWGSPVSLIGAAGPTGATGATGPAGSANILGTTNQLVKFTGSTSGGNSLLFDNGTSVAVGTASPSASALLQLNSTNKGVLFPQVSLDSLKDVNSVPSPANGLVVYNSTQPGVKNDLQRGYYYYSTNNTSWIRLSDNANDNVWQNGGTLGIQLRDKGDGIEMMDDYTGTATNYSPKVKMLNMIDSSALNSKNNIPVLVLTGVNRKPTAGWESRQKTSLIFENNYITDNGASSASANGVSISSYTENTGTTNNNQTNGLAFYVTAAPHNAAADTPSMSIFRHNIGIGHYATDINNVTEGRLQITGFSNGDQLSLRHPANIALKWGLYVSSIDSSLNFYSNGSLRSNIDRVTGVYTALSDKNLKKNVRPVSTSLHNLLKLPVYSFQYLDGEANGRRSIGFMAQDVLPYFPELVYERKDRETLKPFYMLNYDGFGVLAVKAIQEQQALIDEQKKRIDALENELQKIKDALNLK